MNTQTRRSVWRPVAQVSLIILAMGSALAPPASGAILILPAVPGDASTTYRWALEAGAFPIGPGPYPGAIVVQGSLFALLLPSLSHAALLLTARVAGCGSLAVRNVDDLA